MSIISLFWHNDLSVACILQTIGFAVLEKMSSFAFRFHINIYDSTEREIYQMGGLLG